MSDHKCLAFMIKHSLNAGEGELFASHYSEGQHDEISVEFPLNMEGFKVQ